MIITIANLSASIDDQTLQKAIADIATQVSGDFQPEWGAGATLQQTRLQIGAGQAPIGIPSEAVIYLGEKSDDPTTGTQGVFGYHDTNYQHIPYGFVYLDVCDLYDEAWSHTLSHEVLEMLADPTAVLSVSGPAPNGGAGDVHYSLEICDPTRGDGYLVGSTMVSNFVTKAYYGMAGGAAKTNHLNLALAPFGVRPMGNLQYQDGTGSHAIDGNRVDGKILAARKKYAGHRRVERRSARQTNQ